MEFIRARPDLPRRLTAGGARTTPRLPPARPLGEPSRTARAPARPGEPPPRAPRLGCTRPPSSLPSQEPEPEKPFDLDESIFSLRKKTADARSYYCAGPKVAQRAFEIDWSRCNTERFRYFIQKEDDSKTAQDADCELAEVKEVLCKYRTLINSMYAYYCVLGESHDRYVIGALEYQARADSRPAPRAPPSCALWRPIAPSPLETTLSLPPQAPSPVIRLLSSPTAAVPSRSGRRSTFCATST